jgi:hypothetical protein
MATITTAVVVAAALLVMVVIGALVLAYGMPKNRDCDVQVKLFPPAFRFKLTRNDRRVP